MKLLPSPKTARPAPLYRRSLGSEAAKGFAVLLFFFGAGGVWAARAPLSGAVVAHGQLVVGSNVKKVQHPTGGVVAEVKVKDGDLVAAGDLLLKLDETVTAAALAASEKKIDELTARAARLEAERFGFRPLEFPPELTGRSSSPDVREVLDTERELYEARRDAQGQRRMRLEERIKQLEQEVVGLNVEEVARSKLELVTGKELEGLRHLDDLKLVQFQRISQVERDAINLERQKGHLQSSLAQAQGKIVEMRLQIESLDDDLRVETTKELREVQAQLAQEMERSITARDQQKRVEVRAPSGGYIHQNAAHTVGGVIAAGDAIMLIVPQDDSLEVEVRVNPADIDQIHIGQAARIQVQAFDRRTTPKLDGEVSRIGADANKDQQTGTTFYTVRIKLSPQEVAKLGSRKLTAGMLAEAFITTAERTALDYLTRPLRDQIARAMNER